MGNFLDHLQDISTSPLAFAGYIIIATLWTYRYWISKRPSSKLKEIINCFSTDAEKNKAIKLLVGTEPPNDLKSGDLIKWHKLTIRHRSRGLVLIAYITTLLTIIVIISLSIYKANEDASKPPVLIQERVKKHF